MTDQTTFARVCALLRKGEILEVTEIAGFWQVMITARYRDEWVWDEPADTPDAALEAVLAWLEARAAGDE